MNRTSEINVSDVSFEVPKFTNQEFFKDNYTTIFEKGFTEYTNCVRTRYTPNFYHFTTDNIIANSLRFYGEYTELELALLRNFIDNECVIYDIGANIGYHTVGFATHGKHVYAFEPNKLNYKLLAMNTFNNNNVSLFPYAISNSVGTTKIEEFTLGNDGNYGECKITDVGQDCVMTTIDELVNNKQLLPPRLIKIDVEGHEYQVFEGMQQTIREHLPIIFYEAHHCDTVSIYNLLNSLAYTLYYFPCMNYNPNNFYNNKNNIFGQGGVLNILAVPFHLDVKTNLPKVEGANDTWALAVERIQKANATK